MNPEPIRRIIIEKIEELLGEEYELADTVSFKDDLGFDSLDKIELTFALEKALDISITDLEVDNVKTVGDLISIVTTLVNKP